jgi:RNA polymerase sigma factor (sigma-70 family)
VQLTCLLNELTEPERNIIDLRFIQGMTIQEIAKKLRISVATVASRTSRAIARLRQAATHLDSLLD